jgi:hypothetical protein
VFHLCAGFVNKIAYARELLSNDILLIFGLLYLMVALIQEARDAI